MTEKRRLVFDVESVGLHGEAWAIGHVLLLGDHVVDEGWAWCPPSRARGTAEGRRWVAENCPWAEEGMGDAIRQEHQLPAGRRMLNPIEMRDWFWGWWLGQKVQDAELWADVPWPVEARFLIGAVEDERINANREPLAPSGREWEGPFPLFDVRSYTEALLANSSSGASAELAGDDEGTTVLAHHPLADARISAQKLLRVERLLQQCLPGFTPPSRIADL